MADGSFDHKIEKYEPVDAGFSSTQLKWAYYVTTHKVFFRALGIGLLVALDAALVAYALLGFGFYLLGGQTADDLALRSILARLQKSTVRQNINFAAQPLVIGDAIVFPGSGERYDFVSEVENPNETWYALVTYQFTVVDSAPTPTRTLFVLPKEKKYLTQLGVKRPGEAINGAVLNIVNIAWRRINPHDYPNPQQFLQARNKFTITDAAFAPGSNSGDITGGQIKFTITNDSAYNYWQVPIQIALVQSGSLVGVEETNIAELRTGEARAAELRTYTQGLIADEVNVIPSVDVFDGSVYLNQ